MAKTVTVDNLGAEIVLAVRQYTEAVSEATEREVESTSRAVLEDVKANSPVDTGEYKKGWTRTKQGGGGQVKYIIHQKAKPGLAHLLEFGHAKVGGGRVEAKPPGGHIRSAYDKHVPAMNRRIDKIIESGGG